MENASVFRESAAENSKHIVFLMPDPPLQALVAAVRLCANAPSPGARRSVKDPYAAG
jgi:hypothetical protein